MCCGAAHTSAWPQEDMESQIRLFFLGLAFPMKLLVRIFEGPRNLYFSGSLSNSDAQPDLGSEDLISYFPSVEMNKEPECESGTWWVERGAA